MREQVHLAGAGDVQCVRGSYRALNRVKRMVAWCDSESDNAVVSWKAAAA